MSTVDKFQGREKDVVILCLNTLNDNVSDSISPLLSDWRRLYVAFSRARYKLIVVGNRGELEKYEDTSKLFLLYQVFSEICTIC